MHQSASSALSTTNPATNAIVSQSLAISTQVPPDTPEKALLRAQNAQLGDTVTWMSQVAEQEVYQEKHRNYVKLEKALENYKTEYHAAVSEHRHQCQLEVQAHSLQLSQASETERQQSELVYQHACNQANKANT